MSRDNIYIIVIIYILAELGINTGHATSPRGLDEIVVVGRRTADMIGVESTKFDSTALKENISLSMADVLAYRSAVYVKNYGRATLSTVSFRGTSPSHTEVTWNGMRINSPMLGMTDFSTLPAFFIDRASLLHGSASVNETGGGLGGLVKLDNTPDRRKGWHGEYIQGVGSFRTFDEFGRISYSSNRWHISLRGALSTSANDYRFTNHDKKVNIYDDNHNIVSSYHPREKNSNGAFRDVHIMGECYYDSPAGDRFSLNAWWMGTNREIPLLTVDYGAGIDYENEQREKTIRIAGSWTRRFGKWNFNAGTGYVYTLMKYDYRRGNGEGRQTVDMTRSRSTVNTGMLRTSVDWTPSQRLKFSVTAQAYEHSIESRDAGTLIYDEGRPVVGYRVSRPELSGSFSARWEPARWCGMALVVREEARGSNVSSPIPALFGDICICEPLNLILKASVSKNYKYPSLNDLYFLPGGNPELHPERGLTYDTGLSFSVENRNLEIRGTASWFDSRIEDWIIWLPTFKGFFSPRNLSKVHAYGIESTIGAGIALADSWKITFDGSYSWTPSINRGNPITDADKSVGKQLPYVPRHSASAVVTIGWKNWSFTYKWNYYSQRFTMTDNQQTLSGRLPAYYMSNVSLDREISLRGCIFQIKLTVNNIFNEDYLSVLSRPMPGINGEIYLGIKF